MLHSKYLHLHIKRKLLPNVQNPMLDPGKTQHVATYPALSFPKHNTPSPQRWKGLLLHHERKPRTYKATQNNQSNKNDNHSFIRISLLPLPQTAAITCLFDPTPTNHLATLSQDKQAKRARHTQDTLPGTRKRTCSQTESQQHTPLTQILDTVALNSQILIQPNEQPTNSQPNKRTTRSQHISHNHVGVILFTACVIIFFFFPPL